MKRKGTTIIEMVLVLAVTSIISVMVVSFSISANSWIGLGIARLGLMSEEEQVSAIFDEFLEYFDKSDVSFEVENGKLVANTSGGKYTMGFEAKPEEDEGDYIGNLEANIFNSEEYQRDLATAPGSSVNIDNYKLTLTIKCEYFESMQFYVDSKNGKQLVICRAFYNLGEKYSNSAGSRGTYVKVYTTVVPKEVTP